jgi:hypothetical protein
MKRCTIIATCLFNSGMVRSVEDGEAAVKHVFQSEFPKESFATWNSDVSTGWSERIISTVGKASTIQVAKFIDDLKRY